MAFTLQEGKNPQLQGVRPNAAGSKQLGRQPALEPAGILPVTPEKPCAFSIRTE